MVSGQTGRDGDHVALLVAMEHRQEQDGAAIHHLFVKVLLAADLLRITEIATIHVVVR